MIKICIVIPAHWEAIMGGSQYQAKVLIEYLISKGGYDIHYLTSQIPISFDPIGYKLSQIAPPSGIRRYGKFFDALELFKKLKKISPDVVYQRVGCGYTGISAYYTKQYKKRSVWHVAHDDEVIPFKWKLTRNAVFRYTDKKFLEYGIRNVNAIVTQTQQQANYLRTFYLRNQDAVIPNVHPQPKEDLIKKKPIKIVWVANLKQWKRPEIFIRLAKDLEHNADLNFIMIGKPVDNSIWCKKIQNDAAKQSSNLSYLGGQPQDCVNEILSNAHIFINTSKREGFANTFIQAWLRKVPVLSLSVNPDGIFDGEDVGIYCKTYDCLKDNLIKLIVNDKLRQEMGNRAQIYAKKAYSPKNFERLEQIIIG